MPTLSDRDSLRRPRLEYCAVPIRGALSSRDWRPVGPLSADRTGPRLQPRNRRASRSHGARAPHAMPERSPGSGPADCTGVCPNERRLCEGISPSSLFARRAPALCSGSLRPKFAPADSGIRVQRSLDRGATEADVFDVALCQQPGNSIIQGGSHLANRYPAKTQIVVYFQTAEHNIREYRDEPGKSAVKGCYRRGRTTIRTEPAAAQAR